MLPISLPPPVHLVCLCLTLSHFTFWKKKKKYLIYHLETLIQSGNSFTVNCAHSCQSIASCLVDFILCFSMFIFGCMACGILVPQPEIEPALPALEAWSLSHWTSREIPHFMLLSLFIWNTRDGTISNKNATIQGERERMPELPQEMRQDWGRAGAWGGCKYRKSLGRATRNIWHSWLPTKGRSRRGNGQLGWTVHHNYSFSG